MISVCIASYNGEKYIKQQIESILQELATSDEIIISDDGSTDKTLEIINAVNDPRIKLIHNRGPYHGVNPNFNNALSHTSGEYIFLADQDDVWLPGKVKECMKCLEKYDCVVHDAIITDGNLKELGETLFSMVNAREGVFHNWIHNGYLGCAMAFRKDLLRDVLPIPQGMPMYHDTWIGIIANTKYKIKFIDFRGILFRRHECTTSVTAHNRKSISRIIYNRLAIIWFVGKRLLFKK